MSVTPDLPYGGMGLSSPLLEHPLVARLQRALGNYGGLPPLAVDGVYGPLTAAAVSMLKSRLGVPPSDPDRATPEFMSYLMLSPHPPIAVAEPE
jgi:peptidoglycan hydrolase-like protein with peptidoglycan-binding domain